MKTCNTIFFYGMVYTLVIFLGCKNKSGYDDGRKLLTKQNIEGIWKTDNSANPDFKIKGDSILFLESLNQVFPYRIKGDSLIIQFPSFEYGYKVEVFAGDSLRFLSEQLMMTYRKVKQ